MTFIRGNLAIRNHEENKKTLHLFEYEKMGHVRYLGQMRYKSHSIRKAPDIHQDMRDVIIFELEQVNQSESSGLKMVLETKQVNPYQPFTEEHVMFRKPVREFVERELNPFCDEGKKAGIWPAHEILKKMGDSRFPGPQGCRGVRRRERRHLVHGRADGRTRSRRLRGRADGHRRADR